MSKKKKRAYILIHREGDVVAVRCSDNTDTISALGLLEFAKLHFIASPLKDGEVEP